MDTRALTVLITLITYKVVLLGIGVAASRRTQDAADFYLGGRSLGPWVAALSASASSSSAWTLLAVSGAAYAWGVSAAWLFPATVGGFAFNWFVLAPAVQRAGRHAGALTVIALIAGPRERPLSVVISTVCAGIVVVSFTLYVAAQLQGAGIAFKTTFGWGITESVVTGSVVVIAYTLLGGFWAVSLTDTLQGLAMATAAVVLPIAVVVAAGGPAALLGSMAAVEVEGWTHPVRDAAWLGPVGFVVGTLGIGLGYPGQPHVANRFMALREGDDALRIARWVAVGWAVVVYAGMLIVGWGGRVLFPALGDGEAVFIHATNELFPPIISGVLLAAVLSAVMSTADSQLLVAGSSVSHDLGLGRGRSPLWSSRVVVLVVGALAVGAALVTDASIFDRVLSAWWVVGFGLGPALMVTVLHGPVPPRRTLAAVLSASGLTFAANLTPALDTTIVESVVPFFLGLAIVWPWRRPVEDAARLREGGFE